MDIDRALDQLSRLQNQRELTILKLSEPLLPHESHAPSQSGNRSSDVSSAVDGTENPSPASLNVDLTHYKELFTKLRFSYVEQTTKEKFLRAVVGEPPIYVTAAENVALETHLSSVKANLKAKKTEVANLTAELERESRELSRRHLEVEAHTDQLRTLPAEIANLKSTIINLQAAQAPASENPMMNLPLPRVLELIAERKAEIAKLDSKLLDYEATVERKDAELKNLQEELQPLEAQKISAIASAKDARRTKDAGIGGVGGELEDRGRWLRGVDATLRAMLEE